MSTPTPITRLWELDLRAFDATGRRGVHVARDVIKKNATLLDACAAFKALTGIAVTGKQLKAMSRLSTKLTADQLRRALEKRRWENRLSRQFGRAAGSDSVRSVSGGLPGLGRQ